MYENAQAYAVIGAGNASLGQSANLSVQQKPLIADVMLRELSTLIEKVSAIQNRQQNLKDRIFGSSPECASAEPNKDPTPQGFLHEANYKLQLLNSIVDRIIQNCIEFERLA